jgi:octaprenyl-diphosphate synthase
MERSTPAERELVRNAIEHGEVQQLPAIIALVRRTGALDATRAAAQQEADRAISSLALLPDSPARQALLELCSRAIHRVS